MPLTTGQKKVLIIASISRFTSSYFFITQTCKTNIKTIIKSLAVQFTVKTMFPNVASVKDTFIRIGDYKIVLIVIFLNVKNRYMKRLKTTIFPTQLK